MSTSSELSALLTFSEAASFVVGVPTHPGDSLGFSITPRVMSGLPSGVPTSHGVGWVPGEEWIW